MTNVRREQATNQKDTVEYRVNVSKDIANVLQAAGQKANVWAKGNMVRIYVAAGYVSIERDDKAINIDPVKSSCYMEVRRALTDAGYVPYRSELLNEEYDRLVEIMTATDVDDCVSDDQNNELEKTTLQGTKRQVEWAEQIRAWEMTKFDDFYAADNYETDDLETFRKIAEHTNSKDELRAVWTDILNTEVNAAYWIENKSRGWERMVLDSLTGHGSDDLLPSFPTNTKEIYVRDGNGTLK